ncbi:hypothetical protein NJ7G_0382 [Natrinema sp. J7-2]|nr:hypothetical protein NJ7G_0382 [Natrinema sp. J7-2]
MRTNEPQDRLERGHTTSASRSGATDVIIMRLRSRRRRRGWFG